MFEFMVGLWDMTHPVFRVAFLILATVVIGWPIVVHRRRRAWGG